VAWVARIIGMAQQSQRDKRANQRKEREYELPRGIKGNGSTTRIHADDPKDFWRSLYSKRRKP